jgi:hypothetical protein
MTLHSPKQIFSFTDFTARQPRDQPPGDRIDAQFAEHAYAIEQMRAGLSDLQAKAQQQANIAASAAARSAIPTSQQSNAVMVSANSAENWSLASWHWAEYMDGPLPAETVAWMGISGDHWSSRWWANRAISAAEDAENSAIVAESFNDYYLGPHATPPTLDNDGNPLEEGALYFDTSLDQMRVWTGSAWVAGPATMTYAAVDILSNPSGDVAATNVQAAINELAAEKATKAELAAAIALPSHASVSDSAPSSPVVGQLWYDSDNGRLFVFADNFWVQIKGS